MRSVIVTGSSSGIGAALASELSRRGWRVFGLDRDDPRGGSRDVRVQRTKVDVTDGSAVDSAVHDVLDATGGNLNAVVANAGIRIAGAFEETPAEELRRLFDVNLVGAMNVTRAALPALRRTRGSGVVAVSSVGGVSALPGLAAYCGSKWALEGWAESLAHELGPLGVAVSLVEPASVRTGLWDAGHIYGDPDGPYGHLVSVLQEGDDAVRDRALDPNVVALAIADLVETPRRLRSPLGRTAQARLAARGILPAAAQRAIVGRLTNQQPRVASPRRPRGTILVTGCSSGFGIDTTVQLAGRGRRVVATMRDFTRRGPLDDALARAGLAERVEVVQLDVTDRASIDEAFERVDAAALSHGAPLSGLVNNAGTVAVGPFEEIPPDAVNRVLDTNLHGTLAVTHAALPRLRPQGGRIVCITSSSGLGGLPTWSVYAASKWGVEGWAESLAFEVAPHGIDVALVEPGAFATGIWREDSTFGSSEGPYGGLVEAMRIADQKATESGGAPSVVAKVVADVFDARRPATRRPVGRGAWLRWAARGVVPVGLQRKVTERMFSGA